MTVRRRTATVAVAGDTIAYDVIADDAAAGQPTIALIHGSGGNRATWWPLLPLLATTHRVVVLDVRGSGRSTDTAGLLGPEQVSADLEAIRLDAGIDAWQVVGHSLGGWHAFRYAAEHPQTTTSVVALNSVAGCLTPEVLEFLAQFAAMAATWTAGDELTASESFSPAWAADHPAEVALYKVLRDLNPPPRRGVPAERVMEVALSEAHMEVLAGLPVRCVTGEVDPYAPPAVVASVAQHLGARDAVVAGSGHLTAWEVPEHLMRALTTSGRDPRGG